ncbi:MAG: tRNA 2-selenouridine(34) synthase MnmH [Pseudomonadales bacterium]
MTSSLSLREIFIEDVPLIDVRAPVEFARGAFPAATNLPILNDAEREQIGICYKTKGADAAVKLGHALVSGNARQYRVHQWTEFIDTHRNAHLYCFRGGQRSRIAGHWLSQAGYPIPRIDGGYKVMRRYLIDSLSRLPDVVILAGKTGVGKTRVLHLLADTEGASVIDLEFLANHRGSAFGKRISAQPSQISFENALAVAFMKTTNPVVFLEDESRMIGRVNLPLPLQEKMKSAPILVMEDSMTRRVSRIHKEYIVEMQQELLDYHGVEAVALEAHRDSFLSSIDAIRKRLGGDRHREVRKLMDQAFNAQARGDLSLHDRWIEQLLIHYYDPMYEYQLSQKSDRVRFKGNADEILTRAPALLCR